VSLVKIKEQRGENKGKHTATCLQNYLKTKIVFFSIYCGRMECCAVTILGKRGKLQMEIN
jgi:hypothetical protein